MEDRKMIHGLHHFGFGVQNLDESIEVYLAQGFKVDGQFDFPALGAKVALLKKGSAAVELWQFEEPDTDFANKVKSHFAFQSDNLEQDIKVFIDKGYKISMPISAGTVVKRYAYVEDELGHQIELVEV